MSDSILQPDNVQAKLELVEYEVNQWKHKRYRWINASDDELNLEVGDRVWPANEELRSLFILKAIKAPGEKYFPEGGYLVTSSGADRAFFLDALIKHPEELYKAKKVKKKK